MTFRSTSLIQRMKPILQVQSLPKALLSNQKYSLRPRYISFTPPRFSDNIDQSQTENNKSLGNEAKESKENKPEPKKHKSAPKSDEELRERLEQMSGGGGASGIEYEDGQPNTMKRSVRNNMFRYI